MKRIIVALLIAVLLSGCVGSESIAGTYIQNTTIQHYAGYKEYHNQTLVVYPDSTFILKDTSEGQEYAGIVKKEDDSYVFTGSLISFTGKLNHGNLTLDDGSVMVRVR